MAIRSFNAVAQLHSESHDSPTCFNSAANVPACFIYSNHPLAFRLIKDALCSDPHLRLEVNRYSSESTPRNGQKLQILIIDTCSVENWAQCIDKWRLQGGSTIVLISPETRTSDLELKMVYLGAAGLLTFGNDLADQLPRAIHTVAEGCLWIRREILSTYVQRTGTILRQTAVWKENLTFRERQIADLLHRGLSNRSISQRLAICDRTVKFHVSNILRKLNVVNRRELQALGSSTELFYPDRLSPQGPEEILPPSGS